MAKSMVFLCAIGFVFTFAQAAPRNLVAAEFSAEVTALPFPPDARELEFDASGRDINYTSQSPLNSLAAFYLKEMPARGWEHDESAAAIDENSIKLTFKHAKSKVELNLSQGSKEVRVSLECKGLDFSGADDPAKLAKAGIPVPRATLFLQKEVKLPDGVQDLQYEGDGCTLKSSLKLQEAFDYFAGLIKAKGFRESRKPIVTDTRRYTEFKKGSVELSVNVFTHDVGSRIILSYKDDAKEKPVPPLPAVASLPLKNFPNSDKVPTSKTSAATVAKTLIDVSSNKGSAIVIYGDQKHTFANVACFQSKSRGSNTTMVMFSAKPIPLNKLQTLASTKDDVSFNDLYEFNSPDHLVLQLSDQINLSVSLRGVFVSQSVENATNEMQLDDGRVRGTFKMAPEDVFDRPFSFTASVDAAVISPSTRISGPSDTVGRSDSPILADSPVPIREGAYSIGSEGSKFRKKYSAVIGMSPADVAAFYRKELSAKGWKQPDGDSTGNAMQFKNDTLDVSVTIKTQDGKTAIEIITRDFALAKRVGVLPEPGKGRLVMGNASDVGVVYTIGKTDYPLKPGQGAKDFKQALSYSLAPGTYKVVVKIPGKPPETEQIELTEGSSWAILAIPNGEHLAIQLY